MGLVGILTREGREALVNRRLRGEVHKQPPPWQHRRILCNTARSLPHPLGDGGAGGVWVEDFVGVVVEDAAGGVADDIGFGGIGDIVLGS